MTYSTKTARAPEVARIAGCLAGCALDRAEAHGPGVACEACGAREELPWEDYPRAAVVKARSHVGMRRAHHACNRALALGLVQTVHSVHDELQGRHTCAPWRTRLLTRICQGFM